MATIHQMFRIFITRIYGSGDAEHAPILPSAVAAERLQLLLSCGF